ncbi:hypothetical protein R3P38DRAFT_2996500 [Favolaschia claudopus]|uniref:RRM domain-containing protein n=1 Tax=Favolaschia claudopus TaxID=2862362 RepID=A0AAW0ARU4_9AGAR
MMAQDSIRPPAAAPAALQCSAITPPTSLVWTDLEPWMDGEYARQVCRLMGWEASVTLNGPHKRAQHGEGTNHAGYIVLTFETPAGAAAALKQANSFDARMTMPNSARTWALNWAQPESASGHTTNLNGTNLDANVVDTAFVGGEAAVVREYSVFVGDLAPETSNSDLVAVFRNPVLGLRNDRAPRFVLPFVSCKSATIVTDSVTGVSLGYGFVRFTNELDQQRALVDMQGLYCLSRPMRISPARAKINPVLQSLPARTNQIGSTDPYNTTVFVGGLSPLVGEEALRAFFMPFGQIHYVKVPVGKRCGFVQFVSKAAADRAITKMNGFPIAGRQIRLSWGRSQHKAAQAVALAQIQTQSHFV